MSKRIVYRTGNVVVHYDSDLQEYRVHRRGDTADEGYFTSDREDAVSTARTIEREYRENPARMRYPIYSYFSAQTAYHDAHRGRGRGKIGHNTFIVENDGAYSIVLHRTPIVTYHSDGTITLNSGGHRTVTTKARMNEVLPDNIRVYQQQYEWFVTTPWDRRPFHDGMTIQQEGDTQSRRNSPEEQRGGVHVDIHSHNAPKRHLVGYLPTDREGTELTDFHGKGTGWRVDSVVSNWRRPNGDNVKALKLRKGTGRNTTWAGGLWLNDAGTLFRGEVFGKLGASFTSPREASDLAVSEAEYWDQRDAEDEAEEEAGEG